MTTKTCTTCNTEKGLNEFYKDRRRVDGLHLQCKKCVEPIKRRYRQRNKEKISAQNREWRENNKDRASKYAREYYQRMPEEMKDRRSRWWKNNKAKSRKYSREWRKNNKEKIRKGRLQYYLNNSDRERERQRKWRKDNPEKRLSQQRQRRAIKMNASGNGVSADDWVAILNESGNICLCCGNTEDLTLDHVIPISKKGAHDPSNVQPLCRSCNSKKGTTSMDYRI